MKIFSPFVERGFLQNENVSKFRFVFIISLLHSMGQQPSIDTIPLNTIFLKIEKKGKFKKRISNKRRDDTSRGKVANCN